MTNLDRIQHLVFEFDEWLSEASENAIRQNCREQGSVFFKFIENRGVSRGWAAKLIQVATGYNAAVIWQIASVDQVREALNSYYLSIKGIEYEELDSGRGLNARQTRDIVRKFWN